MEKTHLLGKYGVDVVVITFFLDQNFLVHRRSNLNVLEVYIYSFSMHIIMKDT